LFAKPRKRKAPKDETVLGHDLGDGELLGYVEARKRLYEPMYDWVLRHCPEAKKAYTALKELRTQKKVLVLLDFNTNTDVENTSKPLSHAFLIAKKLNGSGASAEEAKGEEEAKEEENENEKEEKE
jgi:hypothetical protein